MDSDRNLLFGVLALQADLIDEEKFVEACTAWAARKATPLADLLLQRGWITPADKVLVAQLMERKLRKHAGDASKSLAAVSDGTVQRALADVADPEIRHTLAALRQHEGHVLLSTIAYQPETRERYTLTRLHAKGGIGQVWLARDGDLGREVALKELRPEQADNGAVWARFMEEARITGQLEHPGIVPVYELVKGSTDKKSFYTMRFVRGCTLTEAIKAHHKKRLAHQAKTLDLLALINAFVGVCHAIAYAHSRGVIHRDLKGQNIVMGDFGEVMVLDWGLAKLVNEPEAGRDDRPLRIERSGERYDTIEGQALGTPAYMAPEQAEGRLDLVDQKSDVYGLGALLYEVLTGEPPFTGSDTLEVLRKVREDDPVRPRLLNRAAPAALEAICLKALAKRPAERYDSALDLARDVQRWLADEPVSAWREPWFVRTRRWLWRHRMIVVAGVSAAAVAMAGMAALLVLQARANQSLQSAIERETEAKAKADERYSLARASIEAYYTGASEDVLLKQPQLKELRVRLLETALQFYRRLQEHVEKTPNLSSTALYGFALDTERIAEIYAQIGQMDDAVRAYEQAIAIWHKIDGHTLVTPGPAKTLIKMGQLERKRGRPSEAFDYYQQAVAIYEELARSSPVYQVDVAWALLQVGDLQKELGRTDEAMGTLERGRDILTELVKESPSDVLARDNLAAVYTSLGNLLTEIGQPEDALSHYRKTNAIYERLVTDRPANNYYRGELARSYNNIGYGLTSLRRLTEALPSLERGRSLREALLSAQPVNQGFRCDLARSEYYIARLHALAGRQDEALRHIQKAEELYSALSEIPPEDRFYRACLLALRIPAVGSGSAELSADQQAERLRYADHAMEALRQAVASGYRKREQFESESDLGPLRSRADFQALLRDLAFPDDSFAK